MVVPPCPRVRCAEQDDPYSPAQPHLDVVNNKYSTRSLTLLSKGNEASRSPVTASTRDPPIWAVRARRCPALAAARNRRFCSGIASCPAAAHLQCGADHGEIQARGGGRTGDLGPCRAGPTPAEPPRGSAIVKIAQGKGTRRDTEGNRNPGSGRRGRTGERRTKGDQGKAGEGGEPGGQTGNRRKARRGTGGRDVRPQTTR